MTCPLRTSWPSEHIGDLVRFFYVVCTVLALTQRPLTVHVHATTGVPRKEGLEHVHGKLVVNSKPFAAHRFAFPLDSRLRGQGSPPRRHRLCETRTISQRCHVRTSAAWTHAAKKLGDSRLGR